MSRFQRGTVLLLGNTLGAYAGYGMILLVYNLYLVALGFHEDFIGLFASVNASATIAGSVGAIVVSQRWGHGWCLTSATAGIVVSGLALAFAAQPATILGFGALNGFALGQIFVPAGPFLVEHTTPDDRQDAFSIVWASQSLSQALGSAVGGVLPAVFAAGLALASPETLLPLRFTLVAGALLSALGLIPTVGLIRLSARPRPVVTGSARSSEAKSGRSDRRLILTAGLIIFLTSISTGFVWPFLNVYFADRLGASTELVGLIFVAISGAQVVAQLSGPALARRYGVVTAIWIARLVTLPVMLGMAFVPHLAYAAFATITRGALVSMSWPLDNAFCLGLVSPRNTARLASTRSISFNAGQSVAGFLAGQVIVGAGYPPTFALSALFILIAGALHYRSFRRDDPHPGLRVRSVRAEASGGRPDLTPSPPSLPGKGGTKLAVPGSPFPGREGGEGVRSGSPCRRPGAARPG
jgi:predicted MFS family arabinose efflux permease